MYAQGLFITGTDTEVGKTIATAGLVAILRSSGIDAVPMKPVQTGCFRCGKTFRAPDLAFCLKMSGLNPSIEEKEWMAPYCFETPASPHLAASKAKRQISLDHIRNMYERLISCHDLVVVEGAGGVLVPVTKRQTMLDMMVMLNLPVIVVVRAGLGTINHTLMTLNELRKSRLTVAGVIMNQVSRSPWGEIEENNRMTIERIGKVKVLGCIPFLKGLAQGQLSTHSFCRLMNRHLRQGINRFSPKLPP